MERAESIGVEEAAQRLGVKPATLYAYVSRGVLRRRRAADGRSLFDPGEVEQLARRGRPRRRPEGSELVIESALTALGADRPYYRGRDALALAAEHGLEEVARWLWTGEQPPASEQRAEPERRAAPGPEWRAAPGAEWRAAPEAVAAGRAVQAALPAEVLPLERLQVIVPALAATDPLRHTVDPGAVASVVPEIGPRLIAGMVESLPGSVAGQSITDRLWGALAPGPVEPALRDVLRVALVLLADHELAASTLAARVAASVRADPYAAVMAGLGAMGGALHGGASLRVEAMLAEARDPAHARRVIGLRLRRGERIPGLGHSVYRDGDARAGMLLQRLRAAAPEHPRLPVVEAMLDEARRRRLRETNVEFALAALVDLAGMTTGAGEAIFAIARTAGWLAHAMEEYARPTRTRARAFYIGPPILTSDPS